MKYGFTGQDRLEYYLVENRQRLSLWEDPYTYWATSRDPQATAPCHYFVGQEGATQSISYEEAMAFMKAGRPGIVDIQLKDYF